MPQKNGGVQLLDIEHMHTFLTKDICCKEQNVVRLCYILKIQKFAPAWHFSYIGIVESLLPHRIHTRRVYFGRILYHTGSKPVCTSGSHLIGRQSILSLWLGMIMTSAIRMSALQQPTPYHPHLNRMGSLFSTTFIKPGLTNVAIGISCSFLKRTVPTF